MATQIAVFVLVVSVFLALADAHDQEVKYGYKGDTAPEKWGSLSPAYQMCSKGKTQSPVNIVKKDSFLNHKLGSLKRDYKNANATLVNNGVNMAILWSCKSGVLTLDGKNFTLKESIWHTPSEHTFNGEKFVAELQHVHYGPDGEIAIISNLYKEGDPDSFHKELKESLAQLVKEKCSDDEQAQIPVGKIDEDHLCRSSNRYYRYRGSLTVPPCTENVTWLVLCKVRELSKEQIEELKAPLDGDCKSNARPTQPLNARQPHLFDEGTDDD